ncbi:hypothetical protein HDZ31DRAFT_34381 [Schizophyllum fasciatum]
MKSFFQRNKSHDPPPPAPSAKYHHRSASAQPELKRAARAPSVRAAPAPALAPVPAPSSTHRADRPDERQHADKPRSSSRAVRPTPAQDQQPQPPLSASLPNGIAHPASAAAITGTYPTDARSRAHKTFDTQSILDRRRDEPPILIKPSSRSKAPSVFEVPAAAFAKTTSTRDDRERRARRHAEEPREAHDDRERARDKDVEERYREKEARRRDREERHRMQELQVQRQQEERDRARRREREERKRAERERLEREEERKRAERERMEREEREEQERLTRQRLERERQEEFERQDRERREREQLEREREKERERERLRAKERERAERERERERRDREKAREREVRRAERHRLKEQERERARLAAGAAAGPSVSAAPPVAASAHRDRTRAREREERQKPPEPSKEAAPNPAFLLSKLVNGKDEGDSSDSSVRKRRVASQLRRHTADDAPSYPQADRPNYGASTSRAPQPAPPVTETQPSTSRSHLRSSSLPVNHELTAQSSSDTDQIKRERVCKRRAPSVRPPSRSHHREIPLSVAEGAPPMRPPSRSHHREAPLSNTNGAAPAAAHQLNGVNGIHDKAQEFTPSSDSKGNKGNSPAGASPANIKPSPPYPAYKDNSPQRAYVPIMQTRSASQHSHFPSAEQLSSNHAQSIRGKFSPATNPSPRSREVKHSPHNNRETAADTTPVAAYPSGYAPAPPILPVPVLGDDSPASQHNLAPPQMLAAGASRETLHLPTPRAVAPSFNIFSHAPPQDQSTVIAYDEASTADPASQATWGSSALRDSKVSASEVARRSSQTPKPPTHAEPTSYRSLRENHSSAESVSKPPLTALNHMHGVPMRTRTASTSDNEERKESPRNLTRKERRRREQQTSSAQSLAQTQAVPQAPAAPAYIKNGTERVAFADDSARNKRAEPDKPRNVPQPAASTQGTGPDWFAAIQPRAHGERSFDAVHGSPVHFSETAGSPALPVPPPVPRLPPPPFGEDESPTVPPFETPPMEPPVPVMPVPEPPEPSPPRRATAPVASHSRERVRDSGLGFTTVSQAPAPVLSQHNTSGYSLATPESIAPQRSWNSGNSHMAPPMAASGSSQDKVTFPTYHHTADAQPPTARPSAADNVAPELSATRRRSQSYDSHLPDVSWSTRRQSRSDATYMEPPPRTSTAAGFRQQPKFEPPPRSGTAAGFRQTPKDSPPKWTSPSRTTVNHPKLAEILSPPPPARAKVSPPQQDQSRGKQAEPSSYANLTRSASVAPGQDRMQNSLLFAEPSSRAPRDMPSRMDRHSPPPPPPQRRQSPEASHRLPLAVEPLLERARSPSPTKLTTNRALAREPPQRPPSRAHQALASSSAYPAPDSYRSYNHPTSTYPDMSAMAQPNVNYNKPSETSQTRVAKQASSDYPSTGAQPPYSRRLQDPSGYSSSVPYPQTSTSHPRVVEPVIRPIEQPRQTEYTRGTPNGVPQTQPSYSSSSRHHPTLSLPTPVSASRGAYPPPSNPSHTSHRPERAGRSQSTSSAIPQPTADARANGGYPTYATYGRATGQTVADHKLRPKASEESLQTPSSLRRSPSRGSLAAFLEPTSSQQQYQAQQDAKRKNGLRNFFQKLSQEQSSSQQQSTSASADAHQVWHPATATKERERSAAVAAAASRDAPSDSKRILQRVPVAPSTRAPPPPPINVQVPGPGAAPPVKSPKVPTSFRLFNPKRFRTISAASHEAADGTAPNTVGSPTASLHSSTPIQPPSLRDPVMATEQWRTKEEEQQRKMRRPARPGVVFDVPEEVPENGRPRLSRQNTGRARSTRTPRVQTPGPGSKRASEH